ncbi:hypothetical protein [Variovorax sp. YR216]|uniref:hypothetical protein n=1 Tax=Variovorax sp. YR216 TaxID=1882828 RepID=UPI000899EEE8|nr:hypothetical protein [Variovorax sp. YR216]SEB22022.1 hypothetical protein SAMN05444680_115124 [Variovorax sp. YR216]
MSESQPSAQPELPYQPDLGDRIVQDDGQYLLVSLAGVPGSKAKGLLLRRRPRSSKTPYGLECLGHHLLLADGHWYASRVVGGDGERANKTTTGIFLTELDALVNLWASRRSPGLALMV